MRCADQKNRSKYTLFYLVATLQLAYRKGLAALERAHIGAERLRDENSNLQSIIKELTLQTAELTAETARLKQERKLSSNLITLEEHKDLITLICRLVAATIITIIAITFDHYFTAIINIIYYFITILL